jgi:two-component system, cell cycle sensor histidine kinase and response regulator CckA
MMNTSSIVLIVDDEPKGRELLEDLLRPQGYELAFAGDGAEALAKAAEIMPDVILLDVMMPGMDGYEVCKSLRANPLLAEVPVLMLTALDDRDSRLYGLEAGADEFLTKPIDRTELRTRVRTITRLNRYRRLLSARSKFDRVVEFAPDGILIIGADTTIELANPAMHQMLRANGQSLIGQKLSAVVSPGRQADFKAGLQSVLFHSSKVLSLQTEFVHLSDQLFPVEITARYFPWEGKPAVQINVRDATEKKKLEAQFLRAQRLQSIGALAGGIAHDLNNILTPILIATQLLRHGPMDQNRNRVIDTIEKTAQRGADIIRQILAFARGVEGVREPIQVKYVISEMENILRDTFPRSIQIKTKIKLELWPVSGDATQLHQVLMNLCINARDAMPQGGALSIEADNELLTENEIGLHPEAAPGRYIKIIVSDTGTGILPELLDKLFDPFFTTKDTGKGTGLGLTTVKGILKSHGGFLLVDSESGEGTRFQIYLPALGEREGSAPEAPSEDFPEGDGELILVVDDETAILEIIQSILERFGYRALTARDGAEAVAIYAKHQGEIQLVLTDAMMPFLDGPGLVRALQRLDPAVKIMGMSGLVEIDKMEELFEATALSFLIKPFTSEALLKSIRQALTWKCDF